MAVVYAVAAALAAGAVGEFLGALQVILERILSLPLALLRSARSMLRRRPLTAQA
jgi:hypothetical protein